MAHPAESILVLDGNQPDFRAYAWDPANTAFGGFVAPQDGPTPGSWAWAANDDSPAAVPGEQFRMQFFQTSGVALDFGWLPFVDCVVAGQIRAAMLNWIGVGGNPTPGTAIVYRIVCLTQMT
jgi:hypothetical protein